MRRTGRLVAAALVAIGVVVTGTALAGSGDEQPASTGGHAPATSTMPVEREDLSVTVSQSGLLTYRAGPDGSPYAVVNRAAGTYTQLPAVGDKIPCGEVLYRVDDRPVLLLCGAVPAYRDLQPGATGNDIRQLNQNLRALGHDGADAVEPDSDAFTAGTRDALAALQRAKGLAPTGRLSASDAVFLPSSLRIAAVAGELGGPAQPGATVLKATSDKLEVLVTLEGAQQGQVGPGDRAHVTLPGNTSVAGTVDRLGPVSRPSGQDGGGTGQGNGPSTATFPVYIALEDPAQARELEEAPVRVDITTEGVQDAMSVPVVALVGKAGGGIAVEVVRGGGRRELVAVQLGLFDTTAGRVQVDGDLREGDLVVVPSS